MMEFFDFEKGVVFRWKQAISPAKFAFRAILPILEVKEGTIGRNTIYQYLQLRGYLLSASHVISTAFALGSDAMEYENRHNGNSLCFLLGNQYKKQYEAKGAYAMNIVDDDRCVK